jgi:hypothetical protein
MTTARTNTPSYETLSGIPPIDIAANVQTAVVKGRRATGIEAETAALRFGPGRLTPRSIFIAASRRHISHLRPGGRSSES